MRTRKILAFAFTAVLLAATTAHAHDMWLEKRGAKVELFYGHPGKIDPYPLSRITAMSGITENGWRVPLVPIEHKGSAHALVNDNFSMLTVEFDNKYWYNTEEDGWRNFPAPVEVRGTIIEEGESYKLAKEIVTWQPFMDKPGGQRAEIVPLKDPTTLKEGDILPVMLCFEGKPMPAKGARISTTSDQNIEHPELVAPANPERIEVKVGPAGRQMIIGKYERAVEGAKKVWFAFSLTFTTQK